jgi:hypothetical protein
MDDLPLEVLTPVCRHLGICDLVRVSQSCTRFRHGGHETAELPTESPVVTALQELAIPRPELVPRTHPVGCSESWVAMARCARQRRCREASPTFVTGLMHSLFVDAVSRLLACGKGEANGHDDADSKYFDPTPVGEQSAARCNEACACKG